MSQHFVESKQPKFFSFKQVIQNKETDLNFKRFIQEFQENFEKEVQRNWLEFWNTEGEKQVLLTWNIKYKNYIKENEKEVEIEQCETDSRNTTESETEKLSLVESESELTYLEKSWDQLWHEHREEIYYEQYSIFATIFYNYFLDLKKSCEFPSPISEDIEEIEEEQVESTEVNLDQELQQLTLLGLPTSFGGRSQYSGRKNKTCQNSTIHYSDYFSDSEMENDCNESDREDERLKDNPEPLHNTKSKSISKIEKRKRNRKLNNVPSFILEEKGLLKYWRKRFSLFSRFDEGIRLDRESWFSVTPEKVAKHLAERLKCSIVVDGFCGSGGNVIQFALTCDKVIAIDIDPVKLELAKHNAEIYKVSHKIDFILGDFLHLAASGKLKADIVFLSPPWGGPKYKNKKEFDIEKYLLPVKASELMNSAIKVSENIALFLPRNANVKQIIKLAGPGNRCEIEHNYLDSRLVAITALYGEEILTKKFT